MRSFKLIIDLKMSQLSEQQVSQIKMEDALADPRVQPFLIERYSKNPEERNRERSFKKPKLGMRRLTDEKKLVPLEVSIVVHVDRHTNRRQHHHQGKV